MTDSCRKSSCGTSQQIKGCLLLCFHRTLFSVCELQPPFILAAVCGLVCALFWCTQTWECGCVCVCGGLCENACGWSPTSCRHCAHVHRLSPSHFSICAHPGDTLSSLHLCVYRADTWYPDLLYVLYAEGNPVSIFHHGDQACPHSFFISPKLAQSCLFAGSVRDMVVSEQVSSPLDKRVAQHPFHLDNLSGVDAPENMARKKK